MFWDFAVLHSCHCFFIWTDCTFIYFECTYFWLLDDGYLLWPFMLFFIQEISLHDFFLLRWIDWGWNTFHYMCVVYYLPFLTLACLLDLCLTLFLQVKVQCRLILNAITTVSEKKLAMFNKYLYLHQIKINELYICICDRIIIRN